MSQNKILIIEDNLIWREKYKKWLGPDYEFFENDNSINAAETFDSSFPDIVILDLGIPNFEDGFRVLDQIISRGRDVKIIVITSSKDHAHALEAARKGAYSYFFKGENIQGGGETEPTIFEWEAQLKRQD